MQRIVTSIVLTALAGSLALAYPAQAAGKAPIATVKEAPLRAHLAFLASDLMEGRGTGQRGGELTVAYLEAQVAALGLKPANGNSYRQPVKIAGVQSQPEKSNVALLANGQPLALKFGDDWVWGPGDAQGSHTLDAELVFAGYGITAPDEKWDDFKDVDVRGKILVVMVNDPAPTAAEPNRFNGAGLTYYGRWTYKLEEAARKGAAGVLMIHTDASASYGWGVVRNSWVDAERFQLADGDLRTGMEGWLTEDSARKLFAAAGQDLDQLRAAAEDRNFKPVPLNARLQGTAVASVRTINEFNVAAVVPGTDPKLKDELVIYSGHWDHLGKRGTEGDTIFNGAVDNASGTAGLLAMAAEAAKNPAKRSQMFLWVAAEEQGLLGSAAYAANPLWPLDKTVAALNLDSLNWVAAVKDVSIPGSERSDLGAIATATAKSMGLAVAPMRPDLGGGFFRSDHFSFAKVGVPSFSVGMGRTWAKDAEAANARAATYRGKYHQANDEYDPSWDLSGMVQQAQYTLNLGRAVADAPKRPEWKAGDPFGQVRAAKK